MTCIIETLRVGLEQEEFERAWPALKPEKGKREDYDPGFWKSTIRHKTFVTTEEIIQGVPCSVFLHFTRGVISHLHYYGSTAGGSLGYAAAARVFAFLCAQGDRIFGPPTRVDEPPPYEGFEALPRINDGRPDERWVSGGLRTWASQGAFANLGEDGSGRLTVQLRMDE